MSGPRERRIRRVLVANLQNAEGATIDPVSGDFLFSTFGGSAEHVYAVRGFNAPGGDDPGDDPPGACVVDHPRGHGYWHRQCMAVDVRDGGLSGSTLHEASSWGKVDTGFEQMVYSEATLAVPLVVGYAYHRRGWKDRAGRRLSQVLEAKGDAL